VLALKLALVLLTLNLLKTTIVAPPSNVSKWQMGFNSAFKGLSLHLEKRHSKFNFTELFSAGAVFWL
jgi:hypothetical protein